MRLKVACYTTFVKIKILYEDKDILAIDKPSGVAVHPDLHSKEKTISDWFVKSYPKAKNVGEPMFITGKGEEKIEIKKPGVVHRLDRETSGVLLLAKNQKAYEFLKDQFKNREVKKTYNAIVSGFVKKDHDIINKPIGRSPRDFRRYLAGRGARGEMREAITEYRVLKRFQAKAYQKFSPRGSHFEPKAPKEGRRGKIFGTLSPFTYLEIHPKTGRTHQIRVHMKFINHPVVCDSLYNPDSPCPKEFKRLVLHAKSIEFDLPAQAGDLKGKTLKIESPLPREFKNMLK